MQSAAADKQGLNFGSFDGTRWSFVEVVDVDFVGNYNLQVSDLERRWIFEKMKQ
jgi:hypothetical protein